MIVDVDERKNTSSLQPNYIPLVLSKEPPDGVKPPQDLKFLSIKGCTDGSHVSTCV